MRSIGHQVEQCLRRRRGGAADRVCESVGHDGHNNRTPFYYGGMSTPPPPFARARNEAQRQDRLARLTAATRELLTSTRATALTLGDVAAAAGLAKSGILRYAGSREALLLRVMHDEHL